MVRQQPVLSLNSERSRILTPAEAAAFWGMSLSHWRRMYRRGQTPRPIRLSARKLGWRVGDLIDGLEKRNTYVPTNISNSP